MLDNGFAPLPIVPGTKRPAPSRWSAVTLDETRIRDWCARFPDHGIGLRAGQLVGLDIDELDADRAHEVQRLAERRFGESLLRIGQWPKRLLLYRTEAPFAKMKVGKVEILGVGQQFVAFGLHAATGRRYYWTDDTPLDVCLEDLPSIDQESASAFLAEVGPGEWASGGRALGQGRQTSAPSDAPLRDDTGRVIDGRDAWLSRIAFHAVHDAIEAGADLDLQLIADTVWARFVETADLGRPKRDGGRGYALSDALRKVHDKLRLAWGGRLPDRHCAEPVPTYELPSLSIAEGRERLDDLLRAFCAQVVAWHQQDEQTQDLPMLGIRATVGLGKSRASRTHLSRLAAGLRTDKLPHRILVFTPSHALAEETAAAWTDAGATVAVMRGYERTDPVSGEPMCRDVEVVKAALSAGLTVPDHACSGGDGRQCLFYDTCLKQQNLRDVATADVVVSPYDALFTGLAFEHDDIALLLVDEGCWARAEDNRSDIYLEDFAAEPIRGMGDGIGHGPTGAMADLLAFRRQVLAALMAQGPGHVLRQTLRDAGITEEDCRRAARLERWRMQDTHLHPGLSGKARSHALRVAEETSRINRLADLWEALGDAFGSPSGVSGRLRVSDPDASGRHPFQLRRIRRLHDSLRGKPVLHLDATLRPDLARTILSGLSIETVDVAAPHMQVRQVQGSFGKSMLCPGQGLAAEERRRRENRLRECVGYVRWHARRVAPGRVLVVTYKAIEAAFDGIPNVETAHFNAVAGLDGYKDVSLLVSIGRPLPASNDLEAMAGAYFDRIAEGRYRRDRAGLMMREGPPRGIDVLRHEDSFAETLRAAICDDELTQVIGRGRGVNRSADDPLEVHVLADVALPLVYERLTTWDLERPDIVQQMLLSGVAVDSPADAAALHPHLFGSANEAKLAFGRAGFKGQNPMSISYREMTLKSAAYKRAGRGRSWLRAYWIEGADEVVRTRLEGILGPLAEWRCEE
ncbi:bifunctional DNA primase/polymerase [Roseivivax sediminis]|uniref:Bifunctional DNA primase/polymerase, N-terminal n=1 Tax=Roseivivax sediminis TaxID=936889 RepID=A0A1I1S8N3_9RHOB|nr:bifunctional DNA primase/polymerase [Roseivivax sediminis]SFD42855.1 Bifunctional DNA primase/polymerase, N-terminal [Roseivivax sediminis]